MNIKAELPEQKIEIRTSEESKEEKKVGEKQSNIKSPQCEKTEMEYSSWVVLFRLKAWMTIQPSHSFGIQDVNINNVL